MKDINMEKIKDKRLTVRMDVELFRRLKHKSVDEDRPMNTIIIEALLKLFDKI